MIENFKYNILYAEAIIIEYNYVFFLVFFFFKKLPIVVVRDVRPSVRPSVRLCQ